MPYVITQRCCNDASCVSVCPVDCIRPTPGEPQFIDAEQLYIDPATCIDCGACAEECPVDAIFTDEDLPVSLGAFADANREYFDEHPIADDPPVPLPQSSKATGPLRVAVVGAGPAACYTVAELLDRTDAEVTVIERLPTPGGLVRSGVAPDHVETKRFAERIDAVLSRRRVTTYLNVDVGTDVSGQELLEHHHAVIYCVGAPRGRELGIPGEHTRGSHSAADFVGWYNGHPDHAHHEFDLSGDRAVVVGNGNVALDVARILVADPDDLERNTDIADHALQALRTSTIREVVVLGRKPPHQAAYSSPEFVALGHIPGVHIAIDASDIDTDAGGTPREVSKRRIAQEYATRTGSAGSVKQIVFRYRVAPVEAVGSSCVTGLRIRAEADGGHRAETIECSMVLSAIGHRGDALPGLPFDPSRGVVPNAAGRVVREDAGPIPGVYVSGWIKRGSLGVIGTNRGDAAATVDGLIADFTAGRLTSPPRPLSHLDEILRSRRPELIDFAGWRAIDREERARGDAAGRPRVKFTAVRRMVAAARP